MLKTIVKIVNTVTAIYVIYLAGSTVYNMGVETGKKQSDSQVTDDEPADNNNHTGADFKVFDGVLYKKVSH